MLRECFARYKINSKFCKNYMFRIAISIPTDSYGKQTCVFGSTTHRIHDISENTPSQITSSNGASIIVLQSDNTNLVQHTIRKGRFWYAVRCIFCVLADALWLLHKRINLLLLPERIGCGVWCVECLKCSWDMYILYGTRYIPLSEFM